MRNDNLTVQKCLDNYKKGKIVIINDGQVIEIRKDEKGVQKKERGNGIVES